MWISIKLLKNSFFYAWKGLKYTYQNEQNFRLQLVAALAVIILMILLRVDPWEAVILLFAIIFILTLEILNTTLERFIDLLKPRLNHYALVIKDMMAAMVFLASLGAVLIGVIIFVPYFLAMIK